MRSPQIALLLTSTSLIAACIPVRQHHAFRTIRTPDRLRGDGTDVADPAHETPNAPATTPSTQRTKNRTARPRNASTVRAGAADDNVEFGAFLDFLATRSSARTVTCDVSDRVIVTVKDQNGLPISNAQILTIADGGVLSDRRTYADGRAMIFRSEKRSLRRDSMLKLYVRSGFAQRVLLVHPQQHTAEVTIDVPRELPRKIPLDLAFILDTTGSMKDEIEKLKKTIDTVHFQIRHMSPQPDVRFGMVLYRDRTSAYGTKKIPFVENFEEFRAALDAVEVGGGGDYPEDVQQGLRVALDHLEWRDGEGARLAFLVGDAPPHLYPGQQTYVDSMREAARRGIKIATIGASGLNADAEVVWRQIAQYTMAPFVFLTRGETGDAEGSRSSVSHHVGANWYSGDLDAIVVRLVKVELANFAPKRRVKRDYLEVAPNPQMSSDQQLAQLFAESTRQLLDYAVERIGARTPTIMLPISAKQPRLTELADQLEAHLAVGLQNSRRFQLIETSNRLVLLDILAKQMSETYDSTKVVAAGKLVPAELAVISELQPGANDSVEMLVRLIRLETAEVMSMTLMKIDRRLFQNTATPEQIGGHTEE